MAYRDHLGKRWGMALVQLCSLSTVAALTLMLLDYQLARHGGEPISWSRTASVRLPALVSPFGGVLLLLFFRHARWRPAATTILAVLFALMAEFGFYELGTNGTSLHVLMLFFSVMCLGSMLPVRRGTRTAIFCILGLSHIGLQLFWDDGRSAGARLWPILPVLLAFFALWLTLELFFTSHRRTFLLRRRMQTTLEQLQASHREIARTAQTLAGSVTLLSQNTTALSSRTHVSREESTKMASASRNIALVANSTLQRSRLSATTAADAQRHAREVDAILQSFDKGVQEMGSSVSRSERTIRELEQRAQRIENFVSTIQGIAGQTHLLSLNASLEAVRAGTQGRGFAIISQQVRKLADEASHSSLEVQGIVESVRAQMDVSVSAMADVRDRTVAFASAFQGARRTLAGIQEVIDALQLAMSANADDAQAQAVVTGDLSTGTQRLLELVQDEASMTAKVADTTQELAQLAAGLRTLLVDAPAADERRLQS